MVVDLQKLKGSLKASTCERPEPPPLSVLSNLIDLQTTYWDTIKRWGEAEPSRSINEAANQDFVDAQSEL